MVQIVLQGRTVQWNSPGLPTEPFRIGVRLGTAEYRPYPINSPNSQSRRQILLMLTNTGSNLASGLFILVQLTASSGSIEHSAYIFDNGTLSATSRGSHSHAPVGSRPAGNVIGFVHTHPVPAAVLAPPSANDYGVSFPQYPTQLVAEMGGRIWALFSGGYSTLLGTFNASGHFFATNAASDGFVYQVVSGDTLRLEAHDQANADEQAGRDRQSAAMRRIAEQRRLEAERRLRR